MSPEGKQILKGKGKRRFMLILIMLLLLFTYILILYIILYTILSLIYSFLFNCSVSGWQIAEYFKFDFGKIGKTMEFSFLEKWIPTIFMGRFQCPPGITFDALWNDNFGSNSLGRTTSTNP